MAQAAPTRFDMQQERDRMVAAQVAARGVRDQRVLQAMREVPREAFISPELEEFAYEDGALPIEEGQTISQPYIVGLMIEAARVKPGDRVLDIGTGSGYAAAVLSRIADKVYSIERHRSLAETAKRRLEQLGYGNVEVRVGDGSVGWPEAAPFDAIIVAAGAPQVPDMLLQQLRIGGRLIIPIGMTREDQRLIVIERLGEHDFHEEDLGRVMFVPLIGEQGFEEQAVDGYPSWSWMREQPKPGSARDVVQLVRAAAERLPEIADPAFAEMFDRFAEARVVLLGEASHGTSEFYRARAAITQRLIEKHGFNIVAVEADWPDAAAIDRYVRHKEANPDNLPVFRRFPTWMWRNIEVHDFVDWLRAHNETLPPEERAGFFGLDLYSLGASIRAVLDYLDRVDPEAARVARERYGCLTPWQRDPATYGRMVLSRGYSKCEEGVVAVLRQLFQKQNEYRQRGEEAYLDAAQNARLVAAAERYYRIMYYGSAESWNLRDRHMFETLEMLLRWRGPKAKAVVWAHNSHIGNASATEMGQVREEINIGQLCRERFGSEAALIGFGTDHGTVAAATDWDGPMEIKLVQPSHRDSYERVCHDSGIDRFLLDLRPGIHTELDLALMTPRLERAIGVIYRPETELASHYFDARLPAQFDGYVWFEETHAVTPLPTEPRPGAPETYPFGL